MLVNCGFRMRKDFSDQYINNDCSLSKNFHWKQKGNNSKLLKQNKMASFGGRLVVSVKDRLRPLHLNSIYRQGTLSLIFRNDYCSGTNVEPRLDSQEVDEDEINHIRDVSRLSVTLKARVRGEFPPNFGERPYHQRKHYRQRLLCKFGRTSGLDPGSMWPSKEKMKMMIEEQAEYEMSVAQMLAEIEKEKQLKEAEDREREMIISERMSKMPEIIADYHKRCRQKEELLKKQAEKKARLLAEAQEYFGFSVDPRDEKFKQMIAEKEAAEKKEEKQRKKAERLAKITAQVGG